MIKTNEVIQGDSLEVLKKVEGGEIDYFATNRLAESQQLTLI